MTPDDLDMHVIYDVSHNIAKVEEHMVDGKLKTLLVHRKVKTKMQHLKCLLAYSFRTFCSWRNCVYCFVSLCFTSNLHIRLLPLYLLNCWYLFKLFFIFKNATIYSILIQWNYNFILVTLNIGTKQYRCLIYHGNDKKLSERFVLHRDQLELFRRTTRWFQ